MLRLSKKTKGSSKRLGAVATGLAPEGEIVLFAADTSRPGPDDVRGRIQLGEKQEAADVDVISLDGVQSQPEGKFRVAYCTDYEIYASDVSYDYNHDADNLKIQKIHSTPDTDTSTKSTARPKFRCIRFLTPQVLIALQNQPDGNGSELLVLEINGMITLRKKLHKKIKSSTALAVSHLDAKLPSDIDQYAIAVAGADTSITILTLDRFTSSPKGNIKFKPHSFHPNVHPTSITALTFSTYTQPETAWKDTPLQYLKLASTSIANTVVVQTLPLTPLPASPTPETTARYILTAPKSSTITSNTFSALVALLAIGIAAFFLQAFTEIRGVTPEYLGAKGWLNDNLHDWIARPYMFEDAIPHATAAAKTQLYQASEAVMTPFGTETPIDSAIEEFQASLASAQTELESSLHAASEAAKTPFSEASAAAGDRLTDATDAVKTPVASAGAGLRSLLRDRNIGSDTSDNAHHDIIVHHSETEGGESSLSAELRDASEVVKGGHEEARRWEELKEEEKGVWRRKLREAGEWVEEEGEAVLQGVLFGGLGSLVGGIVGGG